MLKIAMYLQMIVHKKHFRCDCINIYMKYIISMFDGFLIGDNIQKLFCGCKYIIKDANTGGMLFNDNLACCGYLDLNNPKGNILKVDVALDTYFFLLPTRKVCGDIVEINYKEKRFLISLVDGLKITESGRGICWENVDNLKYSYYEEVGNVLLIYFEGIRNFLVAIKNGELEFSGFIDECNVKDDEKYFMTKLYDSLNHGRVFHIGKNVCEKYLVYLDENELLLKDEFLPFVFLDCVMAKNYNYAKNLTNLDLTNEQAFSFFPPFDFFYPVTANCIVLLNKNTLAGIYSFEIKNSKIENIIPLN